MSTKHTPGPWETRPHQSGMTEIFSALDRHGGVALAYERGETEAANARLLAAAPDLAAACAPFANLAEHWGLAERMADALVKAKVLGAHERDGFVAAFPAARAALQKAGLR